MISEEKLILKEIEKLKKIVKYLEEEISLIKKQIKQILKDQ